MTRIRCAIYTRKSTEEGLEQDFNSLDAQHAACAAYITSQASKGWVALKTRYDDGGISGGTLERPGLKQLMADIADGQVDIVLVYKVDRLTRSLLDFSKLVEAFDKDGVSFVSVTQSFNTTNSMGRLTLNMLLSFAQFEREVTAERIRDKIAASKQRGMWMGGSPPLGYRVESRKLVIHPEEAKLVRALFERHLVLGSVRELLLALQREGQHIPERITLAGRIIPSRPFSRTQMFVLLKHPIYVGLMPHKGKCYPGQHEPLIDQTLWDAVQAKLADNFQANGPWHRFEKVSPLAGKLASADGEPLVATHATKGKVRYRYYVSRHLASVATASTPATSATSATAPPHAQRLRIPALKLEAAIIHYIAERLADPFLLIDAMGEHGLVQLIDSAIQARGRALATDLPQHRATSSALLLKAVAKVVIHPDHIDIHVHPAALTKLLGLPAPSRQQPILLTCPVRIKRSGRAVRLITQAGRSVGEQPTDTSIPSAIARARDWWEQLCADPGITVRHLAQREGIDPGYLGRVLKLAFLDPKLVDAFLRQAAPASISQRKLLRDDLIQLRWQDQRTAMGLR